jgi:hypothetical protein
MIETRGQGDWGAKGKKDRYFHEASEMETRRRRDKEKKRRWTPSLLQSSQYDRDKETSLHAVSAGRLVPLSSAKETNPHF